MDSENNIRVGEIIFSMIGEVSALFMSKPVKGTKIVMPTEELTKIGGNAKVKIVKLIVQAYEDGYNACLKDVSVDQDEGQHNSSKI